MLLLSRVFPFLCFSETLPAYIYLFKINYENTKTMCGICSKLAIKKLGWRHWRRSYVFIIIFEQISHNVMVFLLLSLNK